jgi:tungstate transport system ATP-binding protein
VSLFSIKDLVKIYDTRKVLDIEGLILEEGMIYALFGPNGSGKTTLLEILALLIPPTKGEIHYKGIPINHPWADLTPLRQKIILVQQEPVLFTTSVYKNMEFGLRVRKVPRSNRKRIIEECLDMVGMKDFMFAHAPVLSGGEKQRIAIARALACSPEVLLLDEPTASVDPQNQTIIEGIISDINENKGISVILTTHDLVQAGRLAKKIIPLFNGRLAPSVYENIFEATVSGEPGEGTCLLLRGELKIPYKTEKHGRVRITINPFRVRILDEGRSEVGVHLHQGIITQMTKEQTNIRLCIDAGVPINVIMKEEDVKGKRLFVGERVFVDIPASAIDIF